MNLSGFHGAVLMQMDLSRAPGNIVDWVYKKMGVKYSFAAHLRDTGTGISMILRGPGVFSGGKVCDAMLSNIDVYPTVCDYLGIEKPTWLEGKSFLPVLAGTQPEPGQKQQYRPIPQPEHEVVTRADHALDIFCDEKPGDGGELP